MDALMEKQNLGHRLVQELNKTASSTVTYYNPKNGVGTPQKISAIRIVNRNGTYEVQVSINGGSSSFGIVRLGAWEMLVDTEEIQISASSGSPTYDLFYTIAP